MLTLIALSAALLQDPPAPPPPPMPEVRSRFVFVGAGAEGSGGLDKDNDGQVTREEFAAPLNDAFGRMDKDGDGRLSREELAASGVAGDRDVTVRRLGGEGDIQRFELRRGPEGDGVRVRAHGDRPMVFVSPDHPDGETRVFVRGRPAGPRGERVEVHALEGPGERDLDTDGDGKISEAEFTAPLRTAFARMDADRSGFVEDGERGDGHEVRVFAHRIESRDEE